MLEPAHPRRASPPRRANRSGINRAVLNRVSSYRPSALTGEGLPAPFGPVSNPRRDDRSAGPFITPAHRMNFGCCFFPFPFVVTNPSPFKLYHKEYRLFSWTSPPKSVPCPLPPASTSTRTPRARLSTSARLRISAPASL